VYFSRRESDFWNFEFWGWFSLPEEQKLPEPIPKAENSNTEVNDCVGGTGKCRCVSASPVRNVFPYTTIMDHHHNQTFHLSSLCSHHSPKI
jgi:hypothetical protein